MKKLSIVSLSILLLCGCSEKSTFQKPFSSFERAKLHPVTSDKPAIGFFDGALLGNGGMGVVVTTRPDGIVVYFGHNNVWDIRIAENHKDKIGTFDYGFMDKMGIWFENFSLPVVINECLMQSYDGTIRLFPNWPPEKNAEFHNLRAAGAFLVSAALEKGKVTGVKIYSEAGSRLKILLPWKKGGTITNHNGKSGIVSSLIETDTQKGETIYIKP